MKFFSAVAALATFVGLAAAQESHQVRMTNRCGSGRPVFLYENHPNPQGSGTIQGQLLGGIAWLDGFSGANCLSSGVNCGAVEFTLRNDAPNQNAADFTLEAQPENGHHVFTYPMSFAYTGACTKSANCPSANNCPGAFTNPTNGAPVQCLGGNVGVSHLW
ncbi:hypothetical protein BDY19DRAFT_899253 [Irpex rosettiformis]|uniref:Uncharacterized protein n=1 Tax=Irpex rosettiformis TaxID=378272 RepID=A0ACB8TPM3_9APHY|nr:hypothetical protein BDY19DRAFT_899253 [Irpex rosettiformis]